MRDNRKPIRINTPTRAKPKAKETVSPIIPMPAGIAPAPIRKARGIVSETATFRELEGPMQDRAANPAGKKQTASISCKFCRRLQIQKESWKISAGNNCGQDWRPKKNTDWRPWKVWKSPSTRTAFEILSNGKTCNLSCVKKLSYPTIHFKNWPDSGLKLFAVI